MTLFFAGLFFRWVFQLEREKGAVQGEQGGEERAGSGDEGTGEGKIQLRMLGRQRSSSTVCRDFPPVPDMRNTTLHPDCLLVSLGTQRALWGSTLQARCPLPGRDQNLLILYLSEEHKVDFCLLISA